MKTADLHKKYTECKGISIDTRSISAGQMFFALKGPNFDGHQYIDKAIALGAKYSIIDDEEYKNLPNTILVKDTEKALQNLAKFHRSTLTIPIIGLTGSNGKTTTKELLASVLSQKFSVFATKGNLNNHLGVPISILSIKENHTIAIIEMGANHIGEIKFLSEIAMPNYGLITNIGKAHLEGFGSIEGVRKGKTELYEYIRKVKGKIFYNNSDINLLKSVSSDDDSIVYSNSDIEIINSFPHLKILYKRQVYTSNLSGAYNATNMIAAITIGEYFKVESSQITKGLSSYIPTNNRSEIRKTNHNLLILDAYNANPSSMRVSIENLHNAKARNKVLIVGHMLELGKESKIEHEELIKFITKCKFDKVFIVGHEFSNITIPEHCHYFKNTHNLNLYISDNPLENKTILLKGSRGIALEDLIPSL